MFANNQEKVIAAGNQKLKKKYEKPATSWWWTRINPVSDHRVQQNLIDKSHVIRDTDMDRPLEKMIYVYIDPRRALKNC